MTDLSELDSSGTAPLETVTISSNSDNVRRPRSMVKLNDAAVPGCIDWTVSNNSFSEADTFRVKYAASLMPASFNANTLSRSTEVFLEIMAGFPTDPDKPDPSELHSLIYGRVDDIEYDPFERSFVLTGRDLTAVFIDSKITSQYVHQVSTDIVQSLAHSHQLQVESIVTTTQVGTYYNNDQVQLQAGRSEWDLLLYLAQKEGCVVYVSGKTLFFEKFSTDTNSPFDIVWDQPDDETGCPVSNVIDLTFERDLTVGRGITVTARSPNRTTGKPTVASYPSNPRGIQAGKASSFGSVQAYYFNLSADQTPTQVQAFAKARYDAILSHEVKLRARLPADNSLSIQGAIRVQGTGTAFDQIYYPRLIERQMSMDEGYTMTVEAQSVSPSANPQS